MLKLACVQLLMFLSLSPIAAMAGDKPTCGTNLTALIKTALVEKSFTSTVEFRTHYIAFLAGKTYLIDSKGASMNGNATKIIRATTATGSSVVVVGRYVVSHGVLENVSFCLDSQPEIGI
jgi:hypothetical protein